MICRREEAKWAEDFNLWPICKPYNDDLRLNSPQQTCSLVEVLWLNVFPCHLRGRKVSGEAFETSLWLRTARLFDLVVVLLANGLAELGV